MTDFNIVEGITAVNPLWAVWV